MRVGQRLFLAVIPAVLGVLLVGGLAYWGQYAHRVPTSVLGVAVVAALVSLVLAWQNTRYVAERVELLAGRGHVRGGVADFQPQPRLPNQPAGAKEDELDEIESVVNRLSNDLSAETLHRMRREQDAAARIAEYRRLLVDTSSDVARRLDDVRLPLHILLENRFGELNENQEEMLDAARSAADNAETTVRRLRELAEIELGNLPIASSRVRWEDIVRAVLPGVVATASRANVNVVPDFALPLPSVCVDRSRVQEALSLLLTDIVHAAQNDADVHIRVEAYDHGAILRVDRATEVTGVDLQLAVRLIAAQGGRVVSTHSGTTVSFPTSSWREA